MKIDAGAGELTPSSASPPAPPNAGRRWQSQLEQAFLGAYGQRDRGLQEHAHETANRTPRMPVPRPSERAPANPLPTDTAQAVAGQAVAAPASAWLPGGHPYADLFAHDAALAAARSGNNATADVPAPARSAVSERPPAGRLPGAPAATAERAPATAPASIPRYARQFMQVVEGEHAQVTLRDATLAPEAAEAVARGIVAELRSGGIEPVRVFVNGRRFEAAPPAAPSPFFHDPE